MRLPNTWARLATKGAQINRNARDIDLSNKCGKVSWLANRLLFHEMGAKEETSEVENDFI